MTHHAERDAYCLSRPCACLVGNQINPKSLPVPPPLILPTQGAATAFVEESQDQRSDKTIEDWGQTAVKGAKSWRHGETRTFVIHDHKLAEARRAAREAEFQTQGLIVSGCFRQVHVRPPCLAS